MSSFSSSCANVQTSKKTQDAPRCLCSKCSGSSEGFSNWYTWIPKECQVLLSYSENRDKDCKEGLKSNVSSWSELKAENAQNFSSHLVCLHPGN